MREHARQHEHLEQSMLHYTAFEADAVCERDNCRFSQKQRHFHCCWVRTVYFDAASRCLGSVNPIVEWLRVRRSDQHQ